MTPTQAVRIAKQHSMERSGEARSGLRRPEANRCYGQGWKGRVESGRNFQEKRRTLEIKPMPFGHRDGISDFERLIFTPDWLLSPPETTDTVSPFEEIICRRYGLEILHPAFVEEDGQEFI
jgi:hypothetical protein